MAQGAKKSGGGASKPKGSKGRKEAQMKKRKAFVGHRKGAPKANKKKTKTDKKVTAAIGRNIEKIMAARIAHEGQRMRLIARPDDVESIIKGAKKGPNHGRKAGVDVARSRAHQQKRSKKREHVEMIRSEADRAEKAKEAKNNNTQ